MRLRIESEDMTWGGTRLFVDGERVRCLGGFDLRVRPAQRNALTVHYTEPLEERRPEVKVILDRVLIGLSQEERATLLRWLSRLSREQAAETFDLLLGDEPTRTKGFENDHA